LKKLRPNLVEKSFIRNIETSTVYQNVFAFTSVVLASTFFKLFTDGNYRMIWIVLIISITTIAFHVIYDKISKTNVAIKQYQEYDEHLTLIEKIMQCKGYHLILNASKIEKIEDRSDKIFIFTENLTTDIPKENIKNLNQSLENVGLFADLVANNIPHGKEYVYFLKNNEVNKEYIKEYYTYHFNTDKNLEHRYNINFYLVDEADFTFFTELYLYKDKKIHDMAFEWLPALGEINNANKQFYLELSAQQVLHINEIIIELKTTCPKYNYDDYIKDIK